MKNPHSILQRIFLLIEKFENLKFFHILRALNEQVEKMANRGVQLEQGTLNKQGISTYLFPPP